MAVQANWFTAVADASPAPSADPVDPIGEIDPFDEAESTVMFRPRNHETVMDLPEAVLRGKLAAFLNLEGRLYNRGITCPLKDLPDTSCLVCPISMADDPTSDRCTLCRVGVQEEILLTALAAKRIASDQGDGGGR